MNIQAKRLLLLVCCAAAVVLAYARGGHAAWFLAVYLLLALAGAAGYSLLAFRRFGAQRSTSGTVCLAGDELAVTLEVTLRSALPLPWLVVQDAWMHEGTGHTVIYRKLLFPWFRQSFTVGYRMTGLLRGAYRCLGAEARAGDLFGLAVISRKEAAGQRCTVLPRPDAPNRSVMAFQPDDGAKRPSGLLPARSSASDGVREYVSGDPYHRIHWKASAKLHRLMTKEPERAASAKRMVLLDAEPDAGAASGPLGSGGLTGGAAGGAQPAVAADPLLEKRVALAAGCFEAAARGRESCGLACSSGPTRRIAPAVRPDPSLAYESLASVGGKPALSFPDLVRKEAAGLPPDASMLCITSTLDSLLLRAVAEARSRRRAVHVLYVHARASLSVSDREGAAQLQALGCSFTEVPHPRSEWPKAGGVADATA